MNGQAGKGPELRKGADLKAYWDNYDNIFRKKDKQTEPKQPDENVSNEQTDKK